LKRRDDIHEAFLALGCSLICLERLQADALKLDAPSLAAGER
jgi:hypothetical protein